MPIWPIINMKCPDKFPHGVCLTGKSAHKQYFIIIVRYRFEIFCYIQHKDLRDSIHWNDTRDIYFFL